MAKPAPKRVHSSPVNKHAAAIWDHLEGWHGDDAQDLRDDIEGRVAFLSKKGIDADKIYAALAEGAAPLSAPRMLRGVEECT